MKKEIEQPLYKRLNKERYNDNWVIGKTTNFFYPEDVKEIRLSTNGSKVAIFNLIEGDENSIKKAKANAEYTALAVNNLHILAESLEEIIDAYVACGQLITGDDKNNIENLPIVLKAKEALNNIK